MCVRAVRAPPLLAWSSSWPNDVQARARGRAAAARPVAAGLKRVAPCERPVARSAPRRLASMHVPPPPPPALAHRPPHAGRHGVAHAARPHRSASAAAIDAHRRRSLAIGFRARALCTCASTLYRRGVAVVLVSDRSGRPASKRRLAAAVACVQARRARAGLLPIITGHSRAGGDAACRSRPRRACVYLSERLADGI